jgi:TetR/AcrR family transcriptional regulator, repressor of fatR-cypB operon
LFVRFKDQNKIDSIFSATLELVRDRGLAGITMSDISASASIATGTLYVYFKNKEELIKALFLECREKSAKQYFSGLDKVAPFEHRLKKLFTNIIKYKQNHFEVSVLLEQVYHSPFVCMSDLTKKQKALAPLFELLREGQEINKIKRLEIEMIVSYMFGIIHEIVKKSYFSNKKLSDASIEELYAMFWCGIKNNQ